MTLSPQGTRRRRREVKEERRRSDLVVSYMYKINVNLLTN
jgi:hypothetical protein